MFISRNAVQQKQEQYMGDDHHFNSGSPPVWPSPLCAWCLSEQGIAAGEGSHGICKTHANRLLLQQRKLHSRRIATSV